VISTNEHHATVHLVGSPSLSDPITPAGRHLAPGRLTPAIACAQAIHAGLSPNAPVILVGQRESDRHARQMGLSLRHHLTPPLGLARLARPALRRVAGGVDRVICWSDELAPLATGMADNIELMSTRPDLCTVSPRRFSKITCYTDQDTATWTARGLIPERIDISTLQPVISTTASEARKAARDLLAINDETLLFAAISDRPSQADARGLAFLLTVLNATGFPVSAIAPDTARNAIAARRHHRATDRPYRMLLTRRPTGDWLPGADFVVLSHESSRDGSDAILEAYCHSFGCQIIRLDQAGKPTIGARGDAHDSLLARLDRAMLNRTSTPIAT
jgi:hypothetical protein